MSVAALGLLVGCAPEASPPAPKALDVRIAAVQSSTGVATIDAAGTVQLRRETALAFTTAGQIARITVNEGDRVTRGQLLAALNTTIVDSSRAAADAEVRRAAAELSRTRKLFAQGWVTKVRLDNAQAAYDAAAASARASNFAQDTARIVAPGSGIILSRTADPAQVVEAGRSILVLGEENSGYILNVPVPDAQAATLRSGAPATVKIASLGEREITGTVVQIGGRADPGTGTFSVEIALPPTEGLLSGQIGSASIVASGATGAPRILIPASALFAPRAGEGFVYVVPPGSNRVAVRKVMVGEASDDGFAVLSGVNAGEWVVVSGVDRLRDKQIVRATRRVP